MEKISCIYIIKNLRNNRVYIGETGNYNRRKAYHIKAIMCKCHENPALNEDLQYYNYEDFCIDILEYVENDRVKRLERETYYINLYGGIHSDKTYNYKNKDGYNNRLLMNMSKGRRGIPAWNKGKPNLYAKGRKLSEQTKQKMRENHPDFSGSKNPKYKYTDEFIQMLRDEYNIIHNYSALDRKYSLPTGISSRLIRFGKS